MHSCEISACRDLGRGLFLQETRTRHGAGVVLVIESNRMVQSGTLLVFFSHPLVYVKYQGHQGKTSNQIFFFSVSYLRCSSLLSQSTTAVNLIVCPAYCIVKKKKEKESTLPSFSSPRFLHRTCINQSQSFNHHSPNGESTSRVKRHHHHRLVSERKKVAKVSLFPDALDSPTKNDLSPMKNDP